MDSIGLGDLLAVMNSRDNDGIFGGSGIMFIVLFLIFAIFSGRGFLGFGGGDAAAQGALTRAELYDGLNYNQLENGVRGIQQGLCDGFYAQNTTALQGFNGVQAQQAECCCENRLGIANLGSDIAREAFATRTNDTQNTQAILNTINGGIQSIKDQLCQDKIDAKNDEIANLRQQVAMKDLAAAQTAQNAFISNGFANEVDQLYNRLSNCPVPTTPVYGRTPIFTCNSNNSCGCGCGFNGTI